MAAQILAFILLVRKSTDVEAIGETIDDFPNNGTTALLFAANNGLTAIAQLLLEKGAKINAQDNDGWTPLIAAAGRGYIAMVQLLLEKGADLSIDRRASEGLRDGMRRNRKQLPLFDFGERRSGR